MFKRSFIAYKESFSGLSKEVWWLALVTFINRAGTMVFPFLSLYLTDSKGFTLESVGWIMTSFGFGSIMGAWLGGKLTDKIGYYKVIHLSLIMAGIIFFNIQFLDTFWTFCIGLFLVTLFADMFRPAMYVALNIYSKAENKTRSITLMRLAINLGFSLGPATGGLIITALSYATLFWIDSITCILASALLYFILKEKAKPEQEKKKLDEIKERSPYNDKLYLIFLVTVFLSGFMFMQLFSTMPLYFKNIHLLSEVEIGWLMGMNGLVIFLLEMPLTSYLEKRAISKVKIFTAGNVLIAISLLVFNFSSWGGVLLISLIFITLGEMLSFPFANSFAMDRSSHGKQGEYIALFPVAFAVAHIIGPNSAMQMIDKFGYNFTWYVISSGGVICLVLGALLLNLLKKETESNIDK